MENKINLIDFVGQDLIKNYQQIDGFVVIKELLLHKGVGIVNTSKTVSLKDLEYMALVVYGLKSNKTNCLYVGLHLDKFYLRNDLIALQNGRIKVPLDIFDEVKRINDKYRLKHETN